ncbi:MAG: flagellar hook-basal body protein [Lachnospiraceae bacterium]|nr:flagellar hook-basal body protein [Lachnospiraceae bacterium]
MLKGLYTAYTGMVHEQHRMDTLTNNLANSATVGFKKEGSTSQSFNDVLAYKIKDTTAPANLPKKLGIMNLGVKIGENYTDYSQGAFRETGESYDLAIGGDGFFAIEFTNKAGETSTKYTRDGNFTLTQEGYLTTQEGDYVLSTTGARIRLNTALPSDIDAGGRIYQNNQLVATIQVTDFADYNYLEHYGENYYEPIEGATIQAADVKIYQGYLEQSNVETVQEMVNMIAVSRQYEANQKLIQTYDSSLEIAVSQLGRV